MWYTLLMKGIKSRVSQVKNPEKYGLYVWVTEEGKIFTDDDGNIMNIPAEEYDLDKIAKIRDAARYYGQEGGSPKFIPGVGRATDDEYEQDMERMLSGRTPFGDTQAWEEEMRANERRS